MDYVTNDDITVNMRNLAGVSDTNEDMRVSMRVSMTTAELSQGNTNSHSNDSPGIQDCVYPKREKQDDLSAHMDFKQCEIHSLRNMTGNCFGVCVLTHRLNLPEIDWCWECINRLIWGYRVSCVVTIVTKNRSVGSTAKAPDPSTVTLPASSDIRSPHVIKVSVSTPTQSPTVYVSTQPSTVRTSSTTKIVTAPSDTYPLLPRNDPTALCIMPGQGRA